MNRFSVIRSNRVAQVACCILLLAICCLGSLTQAVAAERPDDRLETEFFEQHVRPLLLRRCGECHVDDQAGGLSLTSREAAVTGGDSGPAVVPGDVQASRLIAAIRRQGDTPMPPDHPLSDREIQILEHWINGGAHWTTELADRDEDHAAVDHWAFQPIANPIPPPIAPSASPHSEIDAFILHRLDAAGLTPSPSADRRTLIRRVSYALTGLPPTLEQIGQFVADDDPQAYQRLVQYLLDSPAYGQHQARMWLDLARYSDTKGYVYAREERFWVHAWNYRDWVVRALNQDMPYDRFLLLQIAADQVDDRDPGDLAAMGFLTLGRRFLGVKHDIIDDRIDVVCRGTMALTVGCARCHDHKYDPIPTADYYSLHGVFDSCSEQLTPLPDATEFMDAPSSELRAKSDALRATLETRRAEQADRIRNAIDRYLWAQTEIQKYPAENFGQLFAKDDLLPAVVHRFDHYLTAARQRHDPVFVAWHAYRSIPSGTFADDAAGVTASLQAGELGNVNQYVLDAFREPPQSMRQVTERYAALFREATPARENGASGKAADQDAAQLWQFLHGDESPCIVPDQGIVHIESFFDNATVTELWKLQGELDRAILAAGESAPHALALVDNPRPNEPRIFRRGNPLDLGAPVPRRFLTALGPTQPFTRGSGRRELAEQIIAPTNPLTARVIVNRIWAQHFGTGLVPTTSDFGRRAEPPSHPELLDYLAGRFIQCGWSLKALHRWILLSSTYRQVSSDPDGRAALARAREVDPENRLLWRMSPHRLTFEEMRDSLLAAGDSLDLRVDGKPEPLLQAPFSQRRTLYGLVDRQFLPSSFRVFDFASPDLHIPQRNETTTAQQALFLMNDPFVVHQAARLAEELPTTSDPGAVIEHLFQRVLRRLPTGQEREDAKIILAAGDADPGHTERTAARDWHYGYGAIDEQAGRVTGFTKLPHQTSDAWQGGPAYPDPALGWVQLNAAGGHPGNDRSHASIRRWIAPRSMVVRIRSEIKHEPAAGDGVRAFIVSSKQGVLGSSKVHQRSMTMHVDEMQLAAGEAVDFLVDIDQVLNSDQYQWRITIDAQAADEDQTSHWDSSKDFVSQPAIKLTPAAQLAQVLMCSNEFLFVD